MPFDFAWEVKEPEFYNDYAHQSKGDDKGYVSGSYRVVLPDTRTQVTKTTWFYSENYFLLILFFIFRLSATRPTPRTATLPKWNMKEKLNTQTPSPDTQHHLNTK